METAADLFTAKLISQHCKSILDRKDHVNTLDLHHRVEVQYPALDLLRHGDEVVILPATNMEHRYDPVPPLVPDEAVTIHSDLTDRNNVASSTVYPIEYNARAPRSPKSSVFASLGDDIQQCRQYAGNTVLRAVLYDRSTEFYATENNIRIRVERTTTFPHGIASTETMGTQPRTSQRTYDWPLRELRHTFKYHPTPWDAQILELVDRSTDKAVRHVASLCRAHDKAFFEELREDERDEWRGKREFDYGAVLDSKAKVIRRNDPRVKDQSCAVCTEAFGPNTVPVELTCHAGHVLCRGCLLYLCMSAETWLEKIKCPQCREPALSWEEMEAVKYGVINGDFYYQEQYTEWENFQRSCADLDKEDITNKTHTVTLNETNRFIIFDSWLYLFLEDLQGIQGPTLEDREVMLAVKDHLNTLSGYSIPANDLFEQLHWAVYKRLLSAYESHGWFKYLAPPPHHIARFTEEPAWKYLEDYLLRPGYSGLITRSLKRALRFVSLRECDRRGPGHEGTRHFHGGRAFFDLNSYVVKLRGDVPRLERWERDFEREDWGGGL
ncbi:uncharacterized protein CLAFUR5_07473 [Fulvia fulva]|uniref:RING-type domain-containing protein n=1 Tax=Passalora fulva TaxID=5499 RepID=A0A9Q8PB16_PASFU|nr:uncharacterized protein CLAFUR5_07473 [Fulvia fulva]UJO19142.1 hypothetical protein CLAFUR5_07473 [Fulvia fulva]